MRPETITVIIPTSGRLATLRMTLQTCLSQEDTHYVVLCSDNSWNEDGTTEHLVELSTKYNHLVVIRPPHELSAPAHWQFALNHVTEGYVIVIGDDDALAPQAIPSLRKLMNAHPGIGVFQWPLSYYFYPGIPNSDIWEVDPAHGHLGVLCFSNPGVHNLRHLLSSYTKGEGTVAEIHSVLYHACVHTSLLQRVSSKLDGLFHHYQYDVFISLAVAAICPDQTVVRHNGAVSLYALSSLSSNARSRNDTRLIRERTSSGELKVATRLGLVLSTEATCLDVLLMLHWRGVLSDVPLNWPLLFQRAAQSIRGYYRLLDHDPREELDALSEAAEVLNEPGIGATVWDETACTSLPDYLHHSLKEKTYVMPVPAGEDVGWVAAWLEANYAKSLQAFLNLRKISEEHQANASAIVALQEQCQDLKAKLGRAEPFAREEERPQLTGGKTWARRLLNAVLGRES